MARVAPVLSPTATRLLIVEDDERYARALSTLLTESFPDLVTSHVTTIEKACKYVDACAVDMVLLDLCLPDADGLQALDRLHDCMNEIPIIVLTGRADEALALTALKAGAEDYLVKDAVDQRTLVRSVRYALERHRVIRDLSRVTKELQVANANLEKLTLIDPLTELLNRRGLQQALSREIKRIERDGINVLVLLVDIDDFKRVNDTLGHAVGDVALQGSRRGCAPACAASTRLPHRRRRIPAAAAERRSRRSRAHCRARSRVDRDDGHSAQHRHTPPDGQRRRDVPEGRYAVDR
jgi:PleD family two-component response regulator